METKIISIDITPSSKVRETTENAGVMWEHNATTLLFNIDKSYIGNYKYYLEYRSLLGTKVRTQYLSMDTDTNTVTYNIPVEMSSLKGVECYFNIVSIDDDGNTAQVIKPYKFYLEFDYSPDTDNSIAKVNDFSINALLEAIRLGTFKGDTGEKGEKGERGEKGEKGDTGEVTTKYANSNFANTIRKTASGNPIIIDDASPLSHSVKIKTGANNNVCVRGKNLIPFDNKKYNGKYQAGQTYKINGVSFTVNDDGSIYTVGTSTGVILFDLFSVSEYATGVQTVSLSGSPDGASSSTYCLRLKNGEDAYSNYEDYGNGKIIENADVSHSNIYIIILKGQTIDATFYPQLEFGRVTTDFTTPVESRTAIADENGNVEDLTSVSSNMSIFGDGDIEVIYNCDTQKSFPCYEEKVEVNYLTIPYQEPDPTYGVSFFGRSIGLKVGKEYIVEIHKKDSVTEETCIASEIPLSTFGFETDVNAVGFAYNNGGVVLDGVGVVSDAIVNTDNMVFFIREGVEKIVIHGVSDTLIVVHKLDSKFLNMEEIVSNVLSALASAEQ